MDISSKKMDNETRPYQEIKKVLTKTKQKRKKI